MKFFEKIKQLRKEKNWTQEELAEKIGTDKRQVSFYENGKSSPSIETVIKIAQTFSVSIDFLLIDNAPRKPLNLKNDYLFDKIEDINLLENEDKEALYKIIDSLIIKAKIQKLTQKAF